jgi:hypothetical protein
MLGRNAEDLMNPFRRSYIASLVILGGISVLASIASLAEGLAGIVPGLGFSALALAAMIPILLKGGIGEHPKLAFAMATGLAMIFGGAVCLGFIEFVATRGGEGPNGEGSPLAVIIAMAFFGLVFFCPWLLTALRGIAAIRQKSDAQQDAL